MDDLIMIVFVRVRRCEDDGKPGSSCYQLGPTVF